MSGQETGPDRTGTSPASGKSPPLTKTRLRRGDVRRNMPVKTKSAEAEIFDFLPDNDEEIL